MIARGRRTQRSHSVGRGFLALGDSLTACTVPGGGTCWPTRVANAIGVPVVNVAQNSSTSLTWRVRHNHPPAGWPCASLLPDDLPVPVTAYDDLVAGGQRARWALLMIGAGDSLFAAQCTSAPAGWPPPTTADAYEANVRALIDRMWADLPGLVGFVLISPPRFTNAFLAAANANLDLYRARQEAIAASDARVAAPVELDLRPILAPSDYGSDILHPLDSGQAKIGNAIAAGLAGYV